MCNFSTIPSPVFTGGLVHRCDYYDACAWFDTPDESGVRDAAACGAGDWRAQRWRRGPVVVDVRSCVFTARLLNDLVATVPWYGLRLVVTALRYH